MNDSFDTDWYPAPEPVSERPVVLIHGFASNAELSWQQTGWLDALAQAGRHVLTFDLPGHGRARDITDPARYTPDAICAALAYRLDTMPDSAAHGADIVGYSLGSRLAWDFADAYPQHVHAMVLGAPALDDPFQGMDIDAAAAYLNDAQPMRQPRDEQLLAMAQRIPGNDAQALLSVVRALVDAPFRPGQLCDTPVLLMAGDKDELAATMPQLAEHARHAELAWLPGRNHLNAVTARAFKRATIDFLAEPTSKRD
ncbi:lysophospholipase [Salinisphaera sp. S4-8]|uniref:alpha/beta fold hydrolase n=1 Tax=Salinisphaera sp. S4-8 TaxID=633357 RepID=UPI00333F3CE6